MTIKVGDRMPKGTFTRMGAKGPEPVSTDDLFNGKKVVLFSVPGAFTPTEILTAWEAGADIVKVFPSEITGPAYLKALRAPLPQVRLMPTGGVNLQTASEFLKAGACALGIGGSLVSAEAIKNHDWAGIEKLAKQYVEIVRHTRQ